MSIRTSDFSSVTAYLDEIVNEATVDKVAGMKEADMLFDTDVYVRKDYIYRILHGVKGVALVPEGSDLPRATGLQGDAITFTQAKYGVQVPITKEMRLFDQYDEMGSIVRSVVEDGLDKIDQSLADVLLNGHATTAYTDVYGQSVTPVGPDGDALFGTHSNGATSSTFSNLVVNSAGSTNVALSRDAVIATRVKGLTYQDVNGLTRPVTLDTLIVAPSNEDLAERTLFSTQIPGEANNDINALKGKIKKLLVWSRLETRGSDGTDTSNRWYMADSKNVKKTLKAKFAQKPTFAAPTQHDNNMDWQYNYDYLMFKGFGFAPFIYGSSIS